jgi:hypothetical protein
MSLNSGAVAAQNTPRDMHGTCRRRPVWHVTRECPRLPITGHLEAVKILESASAMDSDGGCMDPIQLRVQQSQGGIPQLGRLERWETRGGA